MFFLSMILSMITPVLGNLTATYSDETIIIDYASKFPPPNSPTFSFCIHPPDLLRFRVTKQTTGAVQNRSKKKPPLGPDLLERILWDAYINKRDLLRINPALLAPQQKLKSIHFIVHIPCYLWICSMH